MAEPTLAAVRVLDLAAQDRQAVKADLDASLRDLGVVFVRMSDAQLAAKDRCDSPAAACARLPHPLVLVSTRGGFFLVLAGPPACRLSA